MKHTERPRIRIPLTGFAVFIELVGVLIWLVLLILPIWFFADLPDEIPTHFNAAGEPDGFGHKNAIWTLPIVGSVLYLGLSFLNRMPHLFNYPVEITEENAAQQYKNAVALIRFLKVIIVLVFAVILFGSIQTALGNQDGLGSFFLPVFLTILFGGIIFSIVKSMKSQ